MTKLSAADVQRIRDSLSPDTEVAAESGLSVFYVREIRAGRVRNRGEVEVQPRRNYNRSAVDLTGAGFCQVCGVQLHRFDITTNGNGHLLEICEHGHRVIRA